jgi:hypothetical protein
MTDLRISMDITPDTDKALQEVMRREKVDQAEALRRLVGYGALLYRVSVVNGDDVLIRKGDDVQRIVLLHPEPQ